MAPTLLQLPSMAEPDDNESHVERKVVYETVSASSSRQNLGTIIAIVVIALALVVFIVMKMR